MNKGWGRRILWFAGLWLAGIAVLGLAAWLIRLVMQAAGLTLSAA